MSALKRRPKKKISRGGRSTLEQSIPLFFGSLPKNPQKRVFSQLQLDDFWDEATSRALKTEQGSEKGASASATKRDEWNERIFDVTLQIQCDLSADSCDIASVKSLLAIHSDVFAAMFFGTGEFQDSTADSSLDRNDSCVKITDCSKDAMDAINAYVFRCFKWASLTSKNIGEVLYASDKYCVSGLKHGCAKFLEEIGMTKVSGIHVEVLHSLDKWHMRDACNVLLKTICADKKKVRAILRCENAPTLLPLSILQALIEANTRYPVEDVFSLAVKWAENVSTDVATANLDEDTKEEGFADCIAPLIPFIDFEKMDLTFFSKRVSPVAGIISDKRKLDIFRKLVSAQSPLRKSPARLSLIES